MKATMFDKTGKWTPLQSFDDFDNGLSDLIDKWGDDGEDVTEGATGPRVDPMDPTSGGAK